MQQGPIQNKNMAWIQYGPEFNMISNVIKLN